MVQNPQEADGRRFLVLFSGWKQSDPGADRNRHVFILAQVQRRNELRRFTNLDFGHTIRPGMVKPNKTRTKPRWQSKYR